MIISARLGSER